MFEPIVKVETPLSPSAFLLLLRQTAKEKLPDLYFKEVELPDPHPKTIGRLAFGIPNYQGRVWVSEVDEQEGDYIITLAISPMGRWLPKEARRQIKELILEAVKITAEDPRYIKSFQPQTS